MVGNAKVRTVHVPAKVRGQQKHKIKDVLTIPLTFDEHLSLKAPPHLSMLMIQDNKGTPTDWFNVCFRIVCGLRLIEKCYTEETLSEYKPGYDAIQKVRQHYLDTGKIEILSKEDLDNISACLRCVDDMQDEINRETQLYCYKKARTFMMQYVNT